MFDACNCADDHKYPYNAGNYTEWPKRLYDDPHELKVAHR